MRMTLTRLGWGHWYEVNEGGDIGGREMEGRALKTFGGGGGGNCLLFNLLRLANCCNGFVWIKLILLKLKTENWKHCSKIIFKCVNSAVWLIFNEKVAEKWNLWIHDQYIDALFTAEKSTFAITVQ